MRKGGGMSQPQIVIDPYDEIVLVCRLLYYNIPGFHTNAKKLSRGRIFFSNTGYYKMVKTPI
jgi:hypothetical protein